MTKHASQDGISMTVQEYVQKICRLLCKRTQVFWYEVQVTVTPASMGIETPVASRAPRRWRNGISTIATTIFDGCDEMDIQYSSRGLHLRVRTPFPPP